MNKKIKILSAFGLFSLLAGTTTSLFNKNVAVKAQSTSLDDMITYSSTAHHDYSQYYSYQFNFNLGAKIFDGTGHFGDAVGNNRFHDIDGTSNLNLNDTIYINGQPYSYYRDLSLTGDDYTWGCPFPMSVGGIWTPVDIEFNSNNDLVFYINSNYFKDIMGLTITFKGKNSDATNYFRGYNDSTVYELNDDLTFYATLDNGSECSNIKFVKSLAHEKSIDVLCANAHDWTSTWKTNDNYYVFALQNFGIVLNSSYYDQGWLLDHYEYLNQYFLINGKSVLDWNGYARKNNLDVLSNGDQNPLYEMNHPTGSFNANYDRAITINITSKDYEGTGALFIVRVAKQLFIDAKEELTSITLKKGMVFINADGEVCRTAHDANHYCQDNGNGKLVWSSDKVYINDFVNKYMHMSETENTGACKGENGYYAIAKAKIANLTANQRLIFSFDSDYASAYTRIQTWAKFNGEEFSIDQAGKVSKIKINNVDALKVNSNNTAIIITVISLISLTALASLILLKKKKHN